MKKNKDIIKVAVLYRVIQHWRVPMFVRLSNVQDIDLTVFYGADFKGTKVVSGKNLQGFKSKKLRTIKITKKHYGSSRQMPFCPGLFFKLIKENPDVILAEGKSNFVNAFIGLIYAKLFRKKVIWWGLGKLQSQQLTSFKDRMVQRIEKKCDAQLVYSSVGKDYYKSIGYPERKIFTAVNVVQTDNILQIKQTAEYKHIVDSRDNNFNILYMGAINKVKKIDLLVKAFAMFTKNKNDVTLTIVGDGPELPSIKNMIDDLHLNNVVLPGQVVEGNYKYFAQADVFVLPGLGGLAVSEAMAYGLPVICSVGDGCEVDLVDATNGFRDMTLNENTLLSYLEILYTDRDMLDKMKQSSLSKIEHLYNVNTYINSILNCVKTIYNS